MFHEGFSTYYTKLSIENQFLNIRIAESLDADWSLDHNR